VAIVQPLQLVGVWLVGVSMLATAALGLSARYTWYRFKRVTPEAHPIRFWLLIVLGGLLGPVVVAGATYRFGVPLGSMCPPWSC